MAKPRPPVHPVVVTVTEAARMLSCHRSTVYGLIESGHLRANKLGDQQRGLRIPIVDVYAVANLDPTVDLEVAGK